MLECVGMCGGVVWDCYGWHGNMMYSAEHCEHIYCDMGFTECVDGKYSELDSCSGPCLKTFI